MNLLTKNDILVEGILRINPKNYEDAYISVQGEEIDINIMGMADRNQALNGDRVVVKLSPPAQWKILYDTLRDNWEQWKSMFNDESITSQVEKVEPSTKKKKRHRLHKTVANKNRSKSESDAHHDNVGSKSLKSSEKSQSNGQIIDKSRPLPVATVADKATRTSTEKSQVNDANQNQTPHSKKDKIYSSKIYYPSKKNNSESDAHHFHQLNGASSSRKSKSDRNLDERCTFHSDINEQTSRPGKTDFIHPAAEKFQKKLEKKQKKAAMKAEKALKHQMKKQSKIAPLIMKTSAHQSQDDACASIHHSTISPINSKDTDLIDESESDAASNVSSHDSDQDHLPSQPTESPMNGISPEVPIDNLAQALDQVTINTVKPKGPKVRTEEEKAARKLKKEQKKRERRELRLQAQAAKNSPKLTGKSTDSHRVLISVPSNSIKEQIKGKPKNKQPPAKTSKSPSNMVANGTDSINGLPRSLLSLTAEQLLKYPFGKWCVQKTGVVTSILEKNHPRTCCGLISFDFKVPSTLKFIPSDSRIPRILVRFVECPPYILSNPAIYKETVFLAKIIDWPRGSQMPFGTILTEIGPMGQIDSETQMLLNEHEVIDEPFPIEVESALEHDLTDWTVNDHERSYRRDFTNTCVFTIDPLTARDLDDALSITPLAPGSFDPSITDELFEVGVHIADVSFFIPEGSLLDKEAQRRSTSFYLVHRVIHMLPRILSEKACSLTPGEEKLTFSVVWTMDAYGKVYKTWFGRSIIRSCIKLAYEHAFEMISNPRTSLTLDELPAIIGNQWTMADICDKVNLLNMISTQLRKKRFANGALEISKTKYSFALDSQSGLPTGLRAQVSTAAHSLVEELMLLANISVAKKIFQFAPDLAFLRCHPRPDSKLLRELNTFCSNNGIKIDSSTSLSLQQSLIPIKNASGNLYRVVSQFLLRAMPVASYFCSGQVTDVTCFHHFALNEDYYTHFTSPIRRYPDIIVHRLLAASLGYQENIAVESVDLQEIAHHCNKRKTASRLVSEGSQKFFMMLFIKSVPVIETAVVTNILNRSFDVVIISYDLKCRIYMDQFEDGKYSYILKDGKKSLSILWKKSGSEQPKEQVITMSTEIKVLVTIPEGLPMKVKATLVRP